jgi:Ribbon-helix-helix domain
MGAEARWNVKVSQTLDTDLRTFLAERGGKKGDLSNFIEQAVAKALLQETLRDVHSRNQGLSEADALALVESELSAGRAEHQDFWAARNWSAPYQ